MSRTTKRRYSGSKSFDAHCRNHGVCDYCREGRLKWRKHINDLYFDELCSVSHSVVGIGHRPQKGRVRKLRVWHGHRKGKDEYMHVK
jgi:hypothetical protein